MPELLNVMAMVTQKDGLCTEGSLPPAHQRLPVSPQGLHGV